MRVGVFDSGVGGLAALNKLLELCPEADAVFYQDKENAPYGTKTEDELLRLTTADIDLLRSLGAQAVLMACCTASTVWDKLSYDRRKIAIPIIKPTAKEALALAKGRPIGVISTEATAKSGAFASAIRDLDPEAVVVSRSAQELVGLAECGIGDGNMTAAARRTVERISLEFSGSGIGAIILGCTHFSYFERAISEKLEVPAVNSAHVGARELLARMRT